MTGRRPPPGDVGSKDGDPTLGRDEPADGVEQRRLPSAVGADEAHQLAVIDVHRHMVDRDVAPEAHRHVPGLQRRARTVRGCSGTCRHQRTRPAPLGRGLRCLRRSPDGRGLDLGGRLPFRHPPVGALEQLVADAVDDLQQATGEVHQQHQQADAAGQEPDQVVEFFRDGLRDAPDPQRTQDGPGHRAESADDGGGHHHDRLAGPEQRHGLQRGHQRHQQPTRIGRDAAGDAEGDQLHAGGRHG